MIASLRGVLLSRGSESLVLEVGGVGYEILATPADLARLPECGCPVFLHVVSSFGMYGGGETMYGFFTPQEKALFLTFKDCVPSTGAKKALEYLEKASKSLPDFRRAIMEKDSRLLCGVFGFTKKTAERLIDALKDKLEAVPISGSEKFFRDPGAGLSSGALSQALGALSALGYKSSESRAVLQAVAEESSGQGLCVEEILRMALKKL
ncbi:MAG: Holliday junction branch migration protein RuvA [Elusimicrobia bacterium]|nr:Holliday junction branch migration protein RuvA [Elusimicrobiota bacterium]